MPAMETSGDASGPRFPSRDGSETRASEDFFGNLPGVERGVDGEQEVSSSSPVLDATTGEKSYTSAVIDTDNQTTVHLPLVVMLCKVYALLFGCH